MFVAVGDTSRKRESRRRTASNRAFCFLLSAFCFLLSFFRLLRVRMQTLRHSKERRESARDLAVLDLTTADRKSHSRTTERCFFHFIPEIKLRNDCGERCYGAVLPWK